MGVSYTILPTLELSLDKADDRKAFIEHFSSIDSYFFPSDWNIEANSNYPTLSQLYKSLENGQIQFKLLSEELRQNDRVQLCFEIWHELNSYHSDLTIEHDYEFLNSILGIKGDFNILLRLTTQLTKIVGAMIIFSAYDAYYIEEGKEYEEVWEQLEKKWTGKE